MEKVANLEAVIQPFRGGRCPVVIDYKTKVGDAGENVRCLVQLGDSWRIFPTNAVLKLLDQTGLFISVTVEY
ncbi:MAG: hypothetical protein HN642_04775 [Methylococcales bacterium]|nr:hypothetical protein [Methylococcales bacterium]